jgi:predicted neuraminidase
LSTTLRSGDPAQRLEILLVSVLAAVIVSGFGCVGPSLSLPFADLSFAFNLPTTVEPGLISIAGPSVFMEESLFEQIPGMRGHHAATITAFPDGELLTAWYSYPGDEELAGSAIFMARRPAGGAAWEEPRLHIDRNEGDGNPVLYGEGDAVWLFQAVVPFGWSTAHIEMQRSADRGRTWTSPVEIAGPLGANARYAPVRIQDGGLLLPAYDDLLKRCLFFASSDGDQWALQSIVETGGDHHPIQPSITAMADGRLLAVMRNTGRDWLWAMASDDSGLHWSQPIDSGFQNPGSAAALIRLSGDRLVLIYNDSPSERRPLSVALSQDEGRTWPFRRVLADGDESYSYPSAVQSADGLIHIVYSLERRRIQHVTLNEAWIVLGDS